MMKKMSNAIQQYINPKLEECISKITISKNAKEGIVMQLKNYLIPEGTLVIHESK